MLSLLGNNLLTNRTVGLIINMTKFGTLPILLSLLLLAHAYDYCGSHNCYELLGVEQNADENTIKKAFRQLARKHHPDKNQQSDTTELFQMINKAYEVLTDEKSRFKYNLHLQNPEESDYYHEYRYYSNKYIQNPQIDPLLVVLGVLSLVSLLQYVMRAQMYQRAVLSITESHDFRAKVNERCGNNKKIKDTVRQEMIEEISIEGGYSKPRWQDILIIKALFFPYSLVRWAYKKVSLFIKYTIQKKEFSQEDKQEMTIKALGLTPARWENVPALDKADLLSRQLWVRANLKVYQKEMQERYLQEMKRDKPNQYNMYMKYMRKNQ